ncbi:glycosyltransferase family 4 protein [Patescibacteria group bacterium]|nr:glycosyltransferase family 4 protein [Patescibacteria group bacterium]MBU4367630.1 glycosyltransferase family 4 protein [Patescibacteria group bacterium]MBU4462110.1 glycosyltransferase family 4 protein [Patescibacteria group bacterium]MCG2700429.1 glycosyltransferase family 4 protein [Candidatus Parcubacteria bacterium]
MKILWLTWKDRKNPLAGGAEVVNEELAKRLVKDGHEVVFLVGGFKNCEKEEIIDGYKIIRLGNRWSVYWQAHRYYRKNLTGWADLVIDEINTVPFFVKFYAKEKNILFVHQLCREIWFYQMFFPLNLIGYILEPIYLWLLRDRKVITVSQSTKNDLIRFGFKKENINIISEGIEIEPVDNLNEIIKFEKPTILAFGAIKAMKRTHHIIRAFEMAKNDINNLQLVVAGAVEGQYGKKVLKMIEKSKYKDSINYLGKVSKEKKIELMQRSHIVAVTSVKEGWGLVVTEANSQGTPAVVYNVDGLRDAVKNNITGLICDKNTPKNLAEKMVAILKNSEFYKTLQENGWEWGKEIDFKESYKQFISKING